MRILVERMKDDGRLRLIVEGGIPVEAIEVKGEVSGVLDPATLDRPSQPCWIFVDPEKVEYMFNQQKEKL